jgi:hypothetical protein
MLPRLRVGPHDAGEGVAVGDADGGEAEFGRARNVFLRVGGAAPEGEVRGDGELGKRDHGRAAHANRPWTNQLEATVSRP